MKSRLLHGIESGYKKYLNISFKNKPVRELSFIALCSIITLLISRIPASADTVISDPDHISTGIEYRGVPDIRLGDTFRWENIYFEGMAEIRNESRFNQGVLPNHNWRGFVSIYSGNSLSESSEMLKLNYGFEHESAHPTMGLNDGNNSAYDKIYDSTYRNINLNSVMCRLSSSSGSGYNLTLSGKMQFYFFSRNTPELPVNDLAWSEGVSGGFEFQYPLKEKISFFYIRIRQIYISKQ